MDDSGEYVVTESYFSTYNLIARCYSYDVCFASNGVVQLELLMSQLLYIHPWRSIGFDVGNHVLGDVMPMFVTVYYC